MRLSSTEWVVMHVVWERHPVTARFVHDRVAHETGWAFDTVRTILNRLAKKGVLKSELRSNTAHFSPLLTRDEARQSALSWLVEKAFGGARESLVHYLVGSRGLSRREREKLRVVVAETDEKG
jgi:BlaI family transcriptional regulator, penicillinase repressor